MLKFLILSSLFGCCFLFSNHLQASVLAPKDKVIVNIEKFLGENCDPKTDEDNQHVELKFLGEDSSNEKTKWPQLGSSGCIHSYLISRRNRVLNEEFVFWGEDFSKYEPKIVIKLSEDGFRGKDISSQGVLFSTLLQNPKQDLTYEVGCFKIQVSVRLEKQN